MQNGVKARRMTTATSRKFSHAASVPVVEYIALSPAVLYVALVQVVEYLTPAPHGMSQVEVIFVIDAHRNRLPMNWEVEMCDSRDVEEHSVSL